MKRILSMTLLTAAAWAQDGIRGPMPGLVFDGHSKALRPMIGVPGASYLGGALAKDVENATVAPNGLMALAGRDGKLALLDLTGAEARWVDLAAAAGKLRMAWSPDSSVAVVAHEDGRVEIWRNWKEQPQAAPVGNLDGVSILAVDNRGMAAAVSGDGIYRLAEGSNPELLARVNDVSALALDTAGGSLFAASRKDSSVLELADWRTNGGATLVAADNAGILNPEALALSADGRKLIVANAASIVMIDRSTRAVTDTLSLAFKPTRLERLGDGSAFLLNNREPGQPLEVLSGGPDAKVFFVPVEE